MPSKAIPDGIKEIVRGITGESFEINTEKLESDEQKAIEELRKQSKSLSKLVYAHEFRVQEVLGSSYSTSFTPHSERIIGGPSPKYSGGDISELVLKVEALDSPVPIKEILFSGNSPLLSGNIIRAKIPAYLEKKLELFYDSDMPELKAYVPRPFNQREKAIEIQILGENNKVIRTDRSTDCDSFLGKNQSAMAGL